MRQALDLAAAVGPMPGPNPRVGAVVLAADGTVVATGAHHGAGTPHAEVVALAAAGAAAAGATVVVTLEPCDHTGRTGPCTRALLAAGVRRVVYAQADPHAVAAGGATTLAGSGVAVVGGVLAEQAAALNEAWTFAVSHGRPLVTWKVAATLDGRVAAADGSSRWISSAAARADAHRLRAAVGAIVVGTGTALADDPQLTVRGPDGALAAGQPLRVVVGQRPLPPGARVLDDAAATLLLPTRDPAAVLAALHDREIRHVLLEGGPTLAAAFVAAGLVDRLCWYVAPALLGAGPSALADAGMPTIDAALRWQISDVRRVGVDLRVDLRPVDAVPGSSGTAPDGSGPGSGSGTAPDDSGTAPDGSGTAPDGSGTAPDSRRR